jgi:hypothetical protein
MIAKSVIANKFYIIEDTTGKIGTARVSNNVVEVYNTEADTITTLSLVDFEKQFAVENQDRVTKTDYATVYGYPTNAFEVFNERTEVNLPVFTKKKNSSVEYAAGYYAFKFEQKGWTRSMCPKLSTMQDYTWTGPYKTEADMLLAIRQNKR